MTQKNCLLIDDDSVCSLLYGEYLKKLNLEVQSTENAYDAIELCKKNMPDIIILDLQMPKMHGGDFLRELYKYEHDKKPYIVICSGADFADEMFESEDSKKTLQAAGANAFLVKPCNLEDFEKILKDHI